MADNAVANPGAGGVTFATDDIGGVHYPRVKLVWGADGSGNDASAANPIPVAQTGALPAGDNNIGNVDVLTIAAGDNNIGNVDVVTLPALPAGTNNIGDVDVLTLPALPVGNNNIGDVDVASFAAGAITEVQGDVADDAAIAGNPVVIGGNARTSDRTAVANADAVRLTADVFGKQVVVSGALHENDVSGTLNRIDNTVADVIASAGAGRKIVVTSVLVTNAHPTQGTKVTIRDGANARIVGYAAPAGGGFSMGGGSARLFTTAAATPVRAICGTSGADVDITVCGYTIGN